MVYTIFKLNSTYTKNDKSIIELESISSYNTIKECHIRIKELKKYNKYQSFIILKQY